jgi:hypothetical protein
MTGKDDGDAMARFEGGCHCGAIRLAFTTAKSAAELALLACRCSFCRKHATRATADPEGQVVFTLKDSAALGRYEFGWRTASYLVCRTCGVYVGAVVASPAGERALVNVNCLDDSSDFPAAATPVDYAGETAAARVARRRSGWTPSRIAIATSG